MRAACVAPAAKRSRYSSLLKRFTIAVRCGARSASGIASTIAAASSRWRRAAGMSPVNAAISPSVAVASASGPGSPSRAAAARPSAAAANPRV